jgi:hypothetical protein
MAAATSSDDPFQSISDFFDSSTWSWISNALKVAAVALWLAVVYWTWQDARRRLQNPLLIAGATALSLLIPFLGAVVWLIVRPQETMADAHERDLETQALERRVEAGVCPDCGTGIEPKFLSCPSCLRKLREPCSRCGEALDPRWRICPFCETVVAPGLSPLQSEELS